MAKAKRPIAVFKKPGKIGDLVVKANSIVGDIGDHAGLFATPVPALATVSGHITDLETAETAAKTRAEGTAKARDLALKLVVADLHGLMMYVQGLADYETDTEAAENIILSAGFQLKSHSARVKPPLDVTAGDGVGMLKLVAKAKGPKTAYHWQQSTDSISWSNLPVTLKSKTSVGPLSAGKYYFRYSYTTAGFAQSDWSDPVHAFITG